MGALRALVNWKARGWEEKLDRWWNTEGLSASKIGAKLGVSRGAVLGKVHRMGWSEKGQQGGGKGGKRGLTQRMRRKGASHSLQKRFRATNAHEQTIKTVWRKLRGMDGPTAGRCATTIEERPSDPPAGERKTFLDLATNECSWPFEDGTFCARKREGVIHTYCSDHDERAHQPRSERNLPVVPSW